MVNKAAGNDIRDWNRGYQNFEVTYEDKIIDNRSSFIMNMLYELVYETILDRIDISKSFKTLECGCGGARVSVYLAKQGANVTCIDNSVEALRLAGNNFNKENMPCSLLLADILQLPFQSNNFDVTMSYGLLEHFTDIYSPFKEMTRVLKKGGISVHTIIPKKVSLWSIAHAWNFSMGVLVHLRDRNFDGIIKNSRRNFPHYENSYSKNRYLSAMKQTGLDDCFITGITAWAPFNFPKKWDAKLLQLSLRYREKLVQFDRSRSRITDMLAPVYFAVGRKT